MLMHNRQPQQPGAGQAMSYEDFYRELFAQARRGEPVAPTRPTLRRPVNPANPEAISTEEFYRQIFAQARQRKLDQPAEPQPPAPAPVPSAPRNPQAGPQSLEEFYRDLFTQAQGSKPLTLGPRPGLKPPALPERFSRVRGGNPLVSYELLVGEDGRIAAKHESVAGSETYFIYEYDDTGHLLRAWRDGRLAEEYAYDPRGARVAGWTAKQGEWKYAYDPRGKLTAAGPWQFSYAADGSLREAWTPQAAFFLSYDPAGGMSRVVLPGNRVLRCETMPPGLPTEKYIDARPVESLTWRSPLQLATYRDRQRGVQMQFHYTGKGRLPQAVTVQTAQGATNYLLGYDQVGSLKAVAAMDGESEGRVVKVLDFDSFGNVLSDSNPALFLPLAFAGGLRDRFTGLVRFAHRDYDPTVGRFTAPDPLGDTGGDHDLYDYCVDEPVGRMDPAGLVSENAQKAEEENKVPGEEPIEQSSKSNAEKSDESDFLTKWRQRGEEPPIQPHTFTQEEIDELAGKERWRREADEARGKAKEDPSRQGIQWDWGTEGRGVFDGPRSGNWGGQNWSGGRNPELHNGQDGDAPPVDSADEQYRGHDKGKAEAERQPDKGAAMKRNDAKLARKLKELPDNPGKWEKPPAKGKEKDAKVYRGWAIDWFTP